MSSRTPEEVLKSIVDGINTGNLDALMTLNESEAAFATQPWRLNHGLPGVREALEGFISMKGTIDLNVTRVLEASDLALVTTVWSFTGTGPDGKPMLPATKSADVLRRQEDGSWRMVIDNPWGTDCSTFVEINPTCNIYEGRVSTNNESFKIASMNGKGIC